jgi:hypothetical protein
VRALLCAPPRVAWPHGSQRCAPQAEALCERASALEQRALRLSRHEATELQAAATVLGCAPSWWEASAASPEEEPPLALALKRKRDGEADGTQAASPAGFAFFRAAEDGENAR